MSEIRETLPAETPGRITKDNILEYYQIPAEHLETAFTNLQNLAEKMGLKVALADLSLLTNVNDPKAKESGHDTCQSDGKTVYLHHDLKKTGGIVGRVYDLMHVGLGHGTQWSAGPKSGLKFHGDEAWKVATKGYFGAPEEDLQTVYEYELEAGRLAVAYLKKAVDGLAPAAQAKVIALYSDYVRNDLAYIMKVYRTNKIPPFFQNFTPNQPALEDIAIPEHLMPIQRENQCVPLIRNVSGLA